MNRSIRLLTVAAAAALGLAAAARAEALPEGFTSLFNGKDFSGWTVPEGDNGHWKIVDDVIDYDAASESKKERHLWTEKDYKDYTLIVEWRLKETPFVNPRVPYILPDGTHARDIAGKPMAISLPDSDSGILIRGSMRHQLNIWCWPIGSGEMYGVRMDPKTPPEVRAGVTPRTQADKPVGEWNRFEITVRGKTVTVVLNGKTVLPPVEIADLPDTGRIGLQHHGSKKDGQWVSPPSLIQFRNISVREL
ncbi:MAG: hypothetical protein BWK77_05500 [Verrucomicrobia bacterium A1]|nr:MAG: hypothetical protein BWK77_05500 [Verrucomicrobia bacterium A1]